MLGLRNKFDPNSLLHLEKYKEHSCSVAFSFCA